MKVDAQSTNSERSFSAFNGWGMLALGAGFAAALLALVISAATGHSLGGPAGTVAGVFFLGVSIIVILSGLFVLQPNEGVVLALFGRYMGTVRESGLHWINPLAKRSRVSLRVRNFTGGKLKVNDKRGNPIEIAAVVVWHVRDTAKAVFDVERKAAMVSNLLVVLCGESEAQPVINTGTLYN